MTEAAKKKRQAVVDPSELLHARKHAILEHAPQATKEELTSLQSAITLSPEWAAAKSIGALESGTPIGEGLDVPTLMEQFKQQAAAVNSGDFGGPIAMLMNQAVTLQSMFTRLTEKALVQSHMPNLESYMRLALKAQAQSRAALETMAAIKNPPVIYARQANVTTGPQQINNNAAPVTHTRDIESEQNQKRGATHELCQDTRTPGVFVGANEAEQAVGENQRANNTRR
jgi:hypothetical protein